jgi:valyl-tRNA synthetase
MESTEKKFKAIDTASLPRHFNAPEIEKKWGKIWEKSGIYRYDPSGKREDTFVVDTPPPTVSGSLHVGSLFSYTHTDIIVRYQRMTGKKIYYPMGWDDNGLPTERRVQNYFHVLCKSSMPYEEKLDIQAATSKQRREAPRAVSRKNFIELCHRVTAEDEKAFMGLWKRIGLSVDWQEEYATINDHCRRLAQLSFMDLYRKGHVYNREAPTMWDVDFHTAVAQAEVEDRSAPGAYYHITFGVENEERGFTIATTRPELLAACVGVAAHPGDSRYKDLFGKRAVTPLFHVPVPIFSSELADPEKGTGILMVCTFGDATDVEWWRSEKLDLRQIISPEGRLVPVKFGADGWPSLKPDAANESYSNIQGKSIKAAQKIVAGLLRDPAGSAFGQEPPMPGEPEGMQHTVRYYEKGEKPLEFITTRQWFVRLMDKKDFFMEKGNQIQWHPEYMKARYLDWTENLQFDWCISRQRYFGVSFPVWYPIDENGLPDYEKPILADTDQLPVDTLIEAPPGYGENQRDRQGGFTAEKDVFDTWFTSSLSPQIGSYWILDPKRHKKLFPMDIRPQAHDIIRTWAFYTIAKAALHEDTIPWKHAVISGWVLDPDRKKMSKSRGNVVTPMEYLERFTSDGMRYWAGSARLGVDTAFDEKIPKVGKRLVTKIFNAGKFVLSQEADFSCFTRELDRAFVARLRETVGKITSSFERFEFAAALMETESFFWNCFTDSYIELVKNRAKTDDPGKGADRGSAVGGLRLGLNILLRLFAPVLPYVTEEVWSWAFAEETGHRCIHTAPWPKESELAGVPAPDNHECFDAAVDCLAVIHRHKTRSGVSVGKEIELVEIVLSPGSKKLLEPVLDDVMAAARADRWKLTVKPDQKGYEVLKADFR